MKEEIKTLKIFHLSHSFMTTDWLSILGDKYQKALTINWVVVKDINEAEIIVWDGVMTPKSEAYFTAILEDCKSTKVLLLVGEAMTSLKNHSMVKLISLDGLRYVEISGWSVLPEEILVAIEACHQKLTHV